MPSVEFEPIHQRLQAPDANSDIEEVAEILSPHFAKMLSRRGQEECKERREGMLLRAHAFEMGRGRGFVVSDREGC